MKIRVFISGPIQGMEEKQEYRDLIRRICLKYGFEPIDPWLREKVIYRRSDKKKQNISTGFIIRDLKDIERCDMLIAYLPRISAGTCMELFYAKLKGKETVLITELKDLSPWIIIHSDVIIERIEELEDVLKEKMTHPSKPIKSLYC